MVLQEGELGAAIAPDLELVGGTSERARIKGLVANSVAAMLAR